MTRSNENMCKPIFLVGVPRSGTTLLAAIFSAHSDYACGPETMFFRQLTQITLKHLVDDPNWPKEAVKQLFNLQLENTPVADLFEVSKVEMSNYLQKSSPSIQALLEAFTQNFAWRQNKPCWIEKTPDHLLNLKQIRDLYPNAAIVRIVRDPRDTALSLCAVPWASNSFIANCHLWNRNYEQSREFFETDLNSYTVRYEDLVLEPQITLERLCTEIGIKFQKSMLSHASSAKGVTTTVEPWKNGVHSPLNTSRLEAWRNKLSPTLSHAGSLICHKAIVDFGYPEPTQPKSEHAFIYFDQEYIEKNEAELIDLAEQGILIKRATPDDMLNPILNQLSLQGKSSLERLINAIKFILKIKAECNSKPVRFIQKPTPKGICDKACYFALNKWGYPVEMPQTTTKSKPG